MMKQTAPSPPDTKDPLAYSQALRARVSRFLPGWLLGKLNTPNTFWGDTGVSQFTKHIGKKPKNEAEAEVHSELFGLGHLVITSGWPDFFVVSGSDEIFFVEVKGPGDNLRSHQRVVLELLARAGIDTYIKWPEGYEAVGDSIPWSDR